MLFRSMLDMPRAFHDNISMEASLGHNWKKLNYDAGLSASEHNENSLSVINRWGFYPGTKTTIRLGGDYTFIHLDSSDTGLHYGHRGGLYLSSEFKPVKNLMFVVSIKGMTDGCDIIPVPKLGFAWTVNESFTLKNNYFRSFKFPDFNDLYWVQSGFMGNPDLKSEDGWGADLTAEFCFTEALDFNTTVYGQWTEDSIHWNNASGTWRPENSGTAAFFGWDNAIKWTLPFSIGPIKKPVLNLSWVFQLSWLLNDDLSFSDNRRIPYMPMHTFGASLELPWESGSLLVSGRFESTRYAETANNIELDPCFILNLTYNQNLNKNLKLFGKINNALNARYFSFADYPMPGINVTFGLNLIFETANKHGQGMQETGKE